MSQAQSFVTTFMGKLAGVELNATLQGVFAKILANQVVVSETGEVTFKSAFASLSKVFTYVATPAANKPTGGINYADDAIETAKKDAATDNDLNVGGEAPVDPTEPGVPGETFTLTAEDDKIVASDYELAEGETEESVVRSTANDDTIEGALTSRSSSTTFTAEDTIDGGEGTDTLKLAIDKDFRGYSEDKVGIQNIENLELTNEGSRKRKFDVKNIEDLDNIALYMDKAELELAGLADINTVIEAHDLAEGSLKLSYESNTVSSSTDDTLNLVINNLGTASVGVPGCDDHEDAEIVKLDATGLGQLNNLNIKALGDLNLFDLGETGIDSISLSGDAASTSLSNVNGQLNTFDSSAATGKVTADLTGATTSNLEDIQAGSGNTTVSVKATGLSTIVNLDGGEGSNTLKVAADADKTIKPTMENFQTLAVTGAKKLTVSGEGVDGLETVSYGMSTGAELLLANLDNTELTLNLTGSAAGKATYTGEGQLTINTAEGNANPTDCDGELKAATLNTSSATVVASEAEVVDFNVNAFSKFDGKITAAKAEEVTLTVASALYNDKQTIVANRGTEATEFAGTLEANEASVVNLNAEGKLGGKVNASKAEELNLNVAAHDNNLELVASEAQALTLAVEGDKGFTVKGTAANLDKVEELSVTTSGKAAIEVDMNKLASATIAGTGSFAIGTPGTAKVTGTAATATIDISTLALDQAASSYTAASFLTKGGQTALQALAGDTTPITAADIATAIAADTDVDTAVASGNIITVTWVADEDAANAGEAFTLTDGVLTTPITAAVTAGDTGTAAATPFNGKNVGGEAEDVALDATDLLGDFAVKVVAYKDEDAKPANGTADVFGSGVGVNNIEVVGRQTVEITGGVQADTITVAGASYKDGSADTDGIATAMVTGGLGEDTFTFSATATAGKLLATITDFEVGVDVLTDGTAVSFANRAEVVTALKGFDVVSSVNDSAVITEVKINLTGDSAGTAVAGFEYDGDVYVANDDAGVLVQLTGLSEADYDVATTNSFAMPAA